MIQDHNWPIYILVLAAMLIVQDLLEKWISVRKSTKILELEKEVETLKVTSRSYKMLYENELRDNYGSRSETGDFNPATNHSANGNNIDQAVNLITKKG